MEESRNIFGKRMSVESYMASTHEDNKNKRFEVHPRKDKPGFYYFLASSEDKEGNEKTTIGYVPHELGNKIAEGEKVGNLSIVESQPDPERDPMFMLVESKAILSISLD